MKKLKTLHSICLLISIVNMGTVDVYMTTCIMFSITEVTEVKDGGWSIVCHPGLQDWLTGKLYGASTACTQSSDLCNWSNWWTQRGALVATFPIFSKDYRYRPGMIRWPVQLMFFQCLLLSNSKYCMWSCVMKGQVSSSLVSACFSHFLAVFLVRQPRASGMASCQITSTSRSASTFLDLWENQDEHPFSSATSQCLDSLMRSYE